MESPKPFNPQEHRMLEDKKSWVRKETPIRDLEPIEVKQEYNQLVNKIKAKNPELTFQQAYDMILDLEKKYDYKVLGVIYPEELGPKLVYDRRKLSLLRDLNLITEEEKRILDQLENDFNKVIAEIAETTKIDPGEIKKDVDFALTSGTAYSLAEVREIMIDGPIVEGFEDTKDPRISNAAIRDFLKSTFTSEELRKAKIGRISKDDNYMIYRNIGNESKEYAQKFNELTEKNIANLDIDTGMMIATSRENYLQAEMFLEGVDNVNDLKHIYKVRATAGRKGGFHKIQLRSFGIEKSEDFDYLTTIAGSEEDKIKAYILGTINHEVAHRYQHQLEKEKFDDYKRIIDEEVSQQRPRFVSDYVLKHSEIYGSSEQLLLKEDFAESVRIYTTNPDYLKINYPRRFNFIKENFPFIKSGSVSDVIKFDKLDFWF